MRAKILYNLTLLVLLLAAPAAFARPHHAAAKHAAAPRHAAVQKRQKSRTAKATAHKPTRAERRAEARADAAAARHPAKPKHQTKAERRAEARAEAVAARHQPKHQTRAERRAEARAEAKADRASQAEARVSRPEPEPAQPQIHVTHDRKHHLILPPPTVVQPIKWRPRAPETPTIIPAILTYRNGRIIMPAALKGSHEILLHQNAMADQDGLTRIADDDDLLAARQRGTLVAIPTSAALHADDRLPLNRRYIRPWTATFLETLARAHYAAFHTPLQVNSAVRTVEFQQHLLHTNGNAAPAEGETASPHLTGQAVDLAKHGLSITEIAWLRAYLLPLTQQGTIDVEEEFRQACFHISVYRRFVPTPDRRVLVPVRSTAATIAAAIPSVAPALP